MQIVHRTKLNGILTDADSVTLADPTGTYGLRRDDTGAAVVASGTALTRTATGTYSYTNEALAEGVAHSGYVKTVIGSRTAYSYITHTPAVTPTAPDLVLSDHDEVLIEDVDALLEDFGEAVTVHPPAGDDREVTGIVTRESPTIDGQPRGMATPTRVSLPNSITAGISGAEWNNRFELTVARYRGGPEVRMRTSRPVHQDAAMIAWEVQ
jgi:hypothetical protein